MRLQDYLQCCDDLIVETVGDLGLEIAGLTNDSRSVRPGDLFVAIRGAKLDGRLYIDEAIARGAAAVVYSGTHQRVLPLPCCRVADDYAALGRLAELQADYPGHRLRNVGVTGTNGKTTIAYLLREILCRAGLPTGMIGTVVYDLVEVRRPAARTTPTPLELQQLLRELVANGGEAAVLEASSHALVQRRLGTMPFEAAVFTNLTGDHLDYHDSVESYFAAKLLLFTDYLRPGGTAVVNRDDPWGARLEAQLRDQGRAVVCSYGLTAAADCWAEALELGTTGTAMHLQLRGQTWPLRSPLVGRFNVYNVLAAVAAATGMGVAVDDVLAAIEGFAGVPGRMETVPGGPPAVIVDYAHTDDALSNVVSTLRPLVDGRLIVVFGCGGDRDRSKRPRMAAAAAAHADLTIVTSDNPRSEEPQQIFADIIAGMPPGKRFEVEPDRRQAIRQALAAAAPEDTVLVAGKGHEDYQEINGHQHHFSDQEEVLAARLELASCSA